MAATNENRTGLNVLMLDGASEVIGTPTVTVFQVDSSNNVLLARGATKPTDGDAGYAVGCIFIDTDSGVGTTLYMNEGSTTSADFNAITTSAASGVSTWDGLYGLDKTLAIGSTTLTFDLTHATNNGLTLTASGAGSGHVVQITNVGTGKDINGTDNLWAISKAGEGAFQSLVNPTAATDLTIDAGTSGVVNIASTSTGGITLGDDTTLSSAKTMTLTGNASGTAVLTLTAGDIAVSDGKIAITRAGDNAVAFSVTNNSATSATNIAFAGSGTFTGSTTTSFFTVTPSGLTSGTAMYLVAALMDSGKGLHIATATQTSGTSLLVVGGGANITSGIVADIQMGAATGGNGLKISTTGIYATGSSGVLNVTANSATTTTGVVQISSTGLTSGSGVLITSGGANLTGIGVEIALGATTAGTGMSIVSTGVMLTTANLLTLTANSATTAAGLLRINGNGLTTGIGAVITSSATAITGAGRLLRIDHTGATSTSGILSEFASAGTDETVILKVTASAALTGGVALQVSGALIDTGTAIQASDLNALTSGIGLHIASSATAITGAGRLLFVNHTGATGTSATLNEIKSAANDESIVLTVNGTSLLAGGKLLNLSAAAVTTGTILDISDNTAQTTGTAVNIVTNSADTGTRTLVNIKQDHASASGATPLTITNDNATKPLIAGTAAATSTNYFKIMTANSVTLWVGNGTTANGNLSGTAGDICFNAGTNKPEYCTGTTNWTALV